MDLKQDTNKMDKSLKRYNYINANLGFVVHELKNKLEEMKTLNRRNVHQIHINDGYIQSFKTAVFWVVQYIDDMD